MRNHSFNVCPSLIGTISTIGATATGAPIDTLGFVDVLATLCAGAVTGSTGSTVNLAIKIQESATPTGTNWTDITNEAISQGSFNLTTLVFGNDIAGGTTTGTWIPYQSVKKYAKLADANRLRYVRAHATLTGTVGIGPKFAVTLMLGRTDDSYYIQSAVVQSSGNIEAAKLL
jgi:hypothetical protein